MRNRTQLRISDDTLRLLDVLVLRWNCGSRPEAMSKCIERVYAQEMARVQQLALPVDSVLRSE